LDGSSRFGDSLEDAELNKEGLLRTIVVPNNLANLSAKLPKSNYTLSTGPERKMTKDENAAPLLTTKNL
jgi:hypothetical protein